MSSIKYFILVLMVSCGTAPEKEETCSDLLVTSVDEFFAPNIEHVRELLLEYGGDDMPVSRLDQISGMEFVATTDELKQKTGLSGVWGATGEFTCGGNPYFRSWILERDRNLNSLQRTIYHEILHLYYVSHVDHDEGIMGYSKNEKDLSPQIIEKMLHQAIFDQNYKKHAKMRD